MRAALAGQVGQEQQAVAAGGNVAGRRPPGRRTSTPGASASRNQRRLPAADSITDIRCQRSGDGVAEGVDPARAARRSGGPSRRRSTPGGPERQRDRARVDDPDADGVRRLVAAARDDRACRRAAPSPRRPPRSTVPVTAGPSNVGGSQRRVDPERVDDLGRPVARGEVEQDRAGAVGLVERVLAGQAEPDVVLRQQDVGDPRPDVRLVVADPDELRRGEPGQRVVAGDRDQPLRPDRRADRVALGGGPLVVPQDRRAEDRGPRRRAGRARASGRSARSASTSSPATPVVASDGAGSRRRAPSHHSSGSCSLQSGCGTS